MEDIKELMRITTKIQTKHELLLFDDLHYKNPEPPTILKLRSKGLVQRLREVCSDRLFCYLLSSEFTKLKMYKICAKGDDDYFV